MDHLKIISQLKNNVIGAIPYGSRLYGTSTPESDYDYKAVYVPTFDQLLLNKELKVERARFTASGKPVSDSATMEADGLEVENFSLHKLFHDYVRGQAYAMEFVFAIKQGFALDNRLLTSVWHPDMLVQLADEIITVLSHKNVYSMVGFAVKQTLDYVQRGERKKRAEEVAQQVAGWQSILSTDGAVPRLDTVVSYMKGDVLVQHRMIDELSKSLNIKMGETINGAKKMDTLHLNGRDYLETTRLDHLLGAIEKLINTYGVRSSEAAEKDVDWKSLSHAVRVYQQVEEFLDTGFITFPRPNTELLKAIKNGQVPLTVVRELLRELDARVAPRCEASNQEALKALDAKADALLLTWLKESLEC